MVLVDPDQRYAGYTTTDYVKEMSGVEDAEQWNNGDINKKIKAIERFINNELNLSWYPYDDKAITDTAPEDIQEAAAFLASAAINAELKDREKTYTNHLRIGMMLLRGYLGNPLGFRSKFGQMVLSDYLTEPANPDAPTWKSGPFRG